MPTSERRRSPQSEDEGKNLRILLKLISTPASKQQLPSLEHKSSLVSCKQWPVPQPRSGRHQGQSTEFVALKDFSSKYSRERNFSKHPRHERFSDILTALVKHRLACSEWMERSSQENIQLLMTCLRILLRDAAYQKLFHSMGALTTLSEYFRKVTASYLVYGETPCIVEILKDMTNIFQKFAAFEEKQREWLIDCNVHDGLVLLLNAWTAGDVVVLHCSLHALIGLCQSSKPRQLIGQLNCVEILLTILQGYDSLSKKLAAKLLHELCKEASFRDMLNSHDGVPILISQLDCDNVNLLLPLMKCLVQICEDVNTRMEVRQMGAIPLILSLLHCERRLVSERSETSEGLSSAGPHGRTQVDETILDDSMDRRGCHDTSERSKTEELLENKYNLKSACCAAIMKLVMNDANAHEVVQANGIYSLGMLILPPCKECSEEERKLAKNLQRYSFRTLRYIFSMERNRRLFKQLFPRDLFEMFINIGHYVPDLSAYKPLVDEINGLPDQVVDEIQANIMETNHNKTPTRHIGDYSVFELLGTGAFGSVYKVKKKTAGQSFLAMKEVNIENAAFGRNIQERDSSVGEIMNEISIIREQMKHPNVVRYTKTFVENQKLYIVMELIEGAPLGEHFNSLKEKNERFPEERIWNIFMQMILALRYLHKEKGILHRDLTPNNIMLGDDDKVTITDFGLAKQKRSDNSKMTSVVGTMLYWCPEIVQNWPYGEKADVWALGCILYQMCTLKPPFFSDNILALVTKIVNADYEAMPAGLYSDRLVQAVKSCICKSPEERPDTVQLASQMADKLLVHIDSLRVSQITMERKLEKERQKAQRHYFEANQNMQKYHRLFLVSQERYDRLANLAGSGGAAGLKDGEILDPSLVNINIQNESVSSGGWTSDDDDESCPSSECESRESSAGSTRGATRPSSLPRPPNTPKTRRADRKSRGTFSSPLVLEIPNTSRAIRDSGYSSGDPSPNNSNLILASQDTPPSHAHLAALQCRRYQRSNSTPSPQAVRSNKKKAKRPNSANTPTLTISQRRVRQISDPILQMLNQLHKIIYISQLPPTLKPHPKRRIIERFKRALFAPQSTSVNLKSELRKLMSGSREIIDLNLGPVEDKRLGSAGSPEKENDADKVNNQFDLDLQEAGITYERMHTFIEQLLIDSGYYRLSQSEREKSPPLGPIATQDLMKKLTS